jgi:hypothetical protein
MFISVLVIALSLYRKRIFQKITSRNILNDKTLYTLIGLLGFGSLTAILFPKNFEILGQYQPSIELNDFALTTLPLAFIGLGIMFIKRMIPSHLLSTSVLALVMLNLPNLNIAFPQFRLILYCLLILSYGAGKGFKFFYPNISILSQEKRMEILLLSCVLFVVLLTPFVLIDIGEQMQFKSYYTQTDVNSSVIFVNSLNNNDVVIPQIWTQYILQYAGLEKNRIYNERSNFVINTEIYNISVCIYNCPKNKQPKFLYTFNINAQQKCCKIGVWYCNNL